MKNEMKIVFINQDIAPREEVNPFLNGIFLNLTLNSATNEQPIKVTYEAKKRVIDFLERKYSKVKIVNRLIKIFRDLPVHNYIFIYPYCEQFIELYDTLKKSLSYYNNGETDETIALKMKEYMDGKNTIQKCLDSDPYEIQMIVPDKKVIRGEKDKKRGGVFIVVET